MTHQAGATTAVYLGTFDGGGELFNGALDDVRIYNVALSSTQVAQLAAGRYPGTGGYATTTLAANTTANGLFALDAGNFNANGKTFSTGATGPTTSLINCGTYTASSAAQTFAGGLTVQPSGTLTLASSTSSVQLGSGQTLTIDGTLTASTGATIKNNGSGSYAFKVGSTSTARPTLDLTGLAVKNTDANGMWINAVSGASTTFTHFDTIAFNNGATGAGRSTCRSATPST